jgi:DNA modification methylase
LNTVHRMDCLEFMKTLPDGCIDLTVTSPPYDNLRTYNNDIDKTRWESIWKPILQELYRITKEWWVVVWVVWDATVNGSETGTSFKQALYWMEVWFKLHDTMIYKKTWCPFPEQNRYYPIFEYMFIFVKWKLNTSNLIKDRKNLWEWQNVARENHARQKDGSMKANSASKNDPSRKILEMWVRYNIREFQNLKNEQPDAWIHPAIFPEELARDHILSRSNQWDIVFDPFMWSWTTAKMAKQYWRNYLWTELSSEYCNIIHKRLQNTTVSLFHT